MSRREPTDAEWRVMAVEGIEAGEPPMWPSLVIRLLDRPLDVERLARALGGGPEPNEAYLRMAETAARKYAADRPDSEQPPAKARRREAPSVAYDEGDEGDL